MKTSNTIQPSFSVASEFSKNCSDSLNCVSICSSVSQHFRDVPYSFEEDQMAHGLSLNAYNCLQTSLCLCFEGVKNIEMLQTVEMTDSERATVLFLYNQITPRIDSIVEKKKAKADKCRAAGKKGGRPKKASLSTVKKGDPLQQEEVKKGDPFCDSVNTCNNEVNTIEKQDSPTESGKGGYIGGIGEKRICSSTSLNRSRLNRKRGRGEKGLDPLPPYNPPTGVVESARQEFLKNSALENESAPESDVVFEIRRQIADERPDLRPRHHWQRYRPRVVTDLGVTWEVKKNVTPVEALTTIPCPPDFDTWAPLVISAKRGGVPDAIIDAWSRTGGHYDKDENQYYIDYAKKERVGGITVLLLYRVYNYGFGCIGRFSKTLKAEIASEKASGEKSVSTHVNTRPSSKNAVAASGHAVSIRPTPNPMIEEPLPEPETEIIVANPNVVPPKPTVELVPQTSPVNEDPTDEEKRKVLEDYMINTRGLDWDTISYFGDDADWDSRRKSWYIRMKEDGYETKRYLDVPPDCNAKDKLRHPRYIVTKNSGLKNHKREHMFEKDNEVVFLVEGQFDVRALKCAGYLGVGVKKPDQLEEDLRNPNLTAMHFIIVCDSDGTGLSNARKWSEILEDNGFQPHVCHLPKEFADVSAMLKAQGKVAVMRYIEEFMVKEGITAPVSIESADCPF